MLIKYHDVEMVMEQGTSVFYLDKEKSSIIDIIDTLTKEASRFEWEIFVNFLGLSKCYLSVLNVLALEGYTLPMSTDKKRDMRKGDVRYRIAKNTCFYIQAKVGEKRYLTFQTVETVIALKQMPESLDQADENMELYHIARESFLGGLKRSENRILYSSSSISRTSFNRANPQYAKEAGSLRRIVKINGELVRKSVYLEKELRPCIHSGLCFVSELGRIYDGPGIVLDVNSLYDYTACTAQLPAPSLLKVIEGTPKEEDVDRDTVYTIWKCEVSATLKDNGIPCIEADGEGSIFDAGYLRSMSRRYITLTQADRDMLYRNYHITYFRICRVYIFPVERGEFKRYIEPLYEKKRTLPKGPERDFVKNQLVGFIGTFARRVHHDKYELAKNEDGTYKRVRQFLKPDEYDDKLDKTQGLLFVNAAIVSASRKYILSYIRRHRDRFLYTDTDSIHLAGTDIPRDIPVSDKLGDFKVEHVFSKCYYRNTKSYAMVEDGRVITTIAGVPKDFQTYADKSVDAEYLKNVLDNQRLKEIYIADIPVRNITEDITIQECDYTYTNICLTDREDTPKDYVFDETKEERAMSMYNKTYSGGHKTFKEAMMTLKKVMDCI